MLYALGNRNAGEITDKSKSFAWCGMVMHGLACMACMVLSFIDIKSIKVILSDCLDIDVEWKSEEKSKNLNKITPRRGMCLQTAFSLIRSKRHIIEETIAFVGINADKLRVKDICSCHRRPEL